MHGIEEEANLIYADLLAQKLTGTSGDVSLADIVAELQEKGYEIEQVAASGSTITGISLDSSSISVSANGTATITVNYEGSSDGNSYYAVVKGEYYKITETANGITIDRTPSEVDGSGSSGTLAATVTSGDSVTIGEISGNQITINGGSTAGSSVVTVTYGDYTATCTVAVVVTPTDSSVADTSTTFSTNYGTIDVIWLSGTSNTVTTIPNEPILQDENGEAMRLCSDKEIRPSKELVLNRKMSELVHNMNLPENKLDDQQKKQLTESYEDMFQYLLEKLNKEYKIFASIYEKVKEQNDTFERLDDSSKKAVINGLIDLMETGQGNLKFLGLGDRAGRKTGQEFKTDKLLKMIFIDKSVTGMYERRYKIEWDGEQS